MRAPRLLQSVFSAIGDLYLYKLSEVLFGDSVAKWTVSYDFSYSLFLKLGVFNVRNCCCIAFCVLYLILCNVMKT